MIRVGRIPVERRGKRALRNAPGQGVGAIRRLLGVHHHPVVEGHVGGYYGGLRLHLKAFGSAHPHGLAAAHFSSVGEGKNAPALRHNGLRQAVEILDNMKLPLVGKAQALARRKPRSARVGQQLYAGKARAMSRC